MEKTKTNLSNLKEKFQRSRDRHHTTITYRADATSLVRFAPDSKSS